MPNRLIRDGLLDNDRYWSVTIEARQLFLHLMLLADDFGCVSLAPLFLRRRCFNDTPTNEKIAKLTGELADVDLIRCYEHEGSHFAFIPRFRQRLQRATLKHPMPPEPLLIGDDDAIAKFNKIKAKSEIPTDCKPLSSVGQPPEVKRREVKPLALSARGFDEFWDAYPKKRSRGQAERAWSKLKPNEQLIAEILQAIERAKTSESWQRDKGQFIPYPATWLKAKGWQDEVDALPTLKRVAL